MKNWSESISFSQYVPIVFCSVHSFGRSDLFSIKMPVFILCIGMWFHSQLEKNSLTISKLKMPRAHMQALLFTVFFFLDAVKMICPIIAIIWSISNIPTTNWSVKYLRSFKWEVSCVLRSFFQENLADFWQRMIFWKWEISCKEEVFSFILWVTDQCINQVITVHFAIKELYS